MALYDALVQAMPSPVAELNRAVAVGMAFGPRAALDLVDALEAEGALATTTGCPACAATSWPLGRHAEAREASNAPPA